MKRSLCFLIGGVLSLWLVICYPAYLLWGESAMAFSAVAALLCVVPTAATLIWSQRALKGTPEQQLLAVLGGTGVRMICVIAAAMVLYHSISFFHHQGFWIWVIVFYLLTLSLEISLVVAGNSAPDGARTN